MFGLKELKELNRELVTEVTNMLTGARIQLASSVAASQNRVGSIRTFPDGSYSKFDMTCLRQADEHQQPIYYTANIIFCAINATARVDYL